MIDLDELLDGVDALTSGYQGWECDGSASICDQRLDALESLADALVSVRAERDAALTRIAEAAELHRKYTYYEHEDSCPDTTEEHRKEHHHKSDEIGEFYCDQMPTGEAYCEHCRDSSEGLFAWPCPTAVSLGLNEGEVAGDE